MAIVFSALVLAPANAAPQDNGTSFTRQQDVIYKRTYGTVLTMDIFEPANNSHGATVIWVVSGGWYSSHAGIDPDVPLSPITRLTERGYRVCAVVHGSNPLFTIEDAISDIERAVRFARYTAMQNGATNVPIGIMGGSAGGHLSLMAATTGDDGNPEAEDPVERISSRIQAVACFYPPTDFLNYGKPGQNGAETILKKDYSAPFQFRRYQEDTKTLERVSDPQMKREILRQVSPITHVSEQTPPILIIHGDADELVPFQQAELFADKMKQHGAVIEVVRKAGEAHGWEGMEKEYELLYDWIDKHVL